MVVAAPCALIISDPGFHFVRDRRHGPAWRVVQSGVHVERSNDEGRGLRQTGTLTETRPRVTDLIVDRRVVNFLSEPDASAVALLQLVGAGRGQIRALAQTIVTESKQRGQVSEECTAFNPLLAKARAAL